MTHVIDHLSADSINTTGSGHQQLLFEQAENMTLLVSEQEGQTVERDGASTLSCP